MRMRRRREEGRRGESKTSKNGVQWRGVQGDEKIVKADTSRDG